MLDSTELDVLYEDNHLLVINKPALLPTMGAQSGQASLVDKARQYLKQKYRKPGNVYIGVVSRLDSFVSGVIVMARTSKAAARLTKQFATQQPHKSYLAITPDIRQLSSASGPLELEHWVVKDERNHRMMTVEKDHPDSPKSARLQIQQIGHFQQQNLVEVKLFTGRKHQIRVQLAAIGCPIVGDRKYGSKLTFPKGIALHSQMLTFEHPTKKEPVTIEQAPPEYWNLRRFHAS